MNLNLAGKTALVLGASRGLGLASAIELGREGVNVMIGSPGNERHERALYQLREAGVTNAEALTIDVRNAAHAQHAIDDTVARFASLDILVNNAGGPPFGAFDAFDDDAWQNAFELSFLSVARFTRLALPHLRRTGEGRVINIISYSVRHAVQGSILSTSMRMGVVGLAKLLSREAGDYGITVNNVAAGMILTDRIRESALKDKFDEGKSEQQGLAELTDEVPLKRLGRPEELGALVAFLASGRASYINGTTVQVDGGLGRALL
ncbi:SDR family oxidoreductase [Paraburkholderia sp. CNPSo 3076]|uniref:SDR family oxidoreductase n=1 Tax=Paraburkholderia sp. CNPSo 3076 TaxID=2940936 RepID=UPI00225258DE|nr:SDR family oxidoreductase [Paraburkholderia sp. CNPSo 3076]MCX5545560.1 SDR family oxidoreductase [Paraburkholderia sp. CNPSo 3076]